MLNNKEKLLEALDNLRRMIVDDTIEVLDATVRFTNDIGRTPRSERAMTNYSTTGDSRIHLELDYEIRDTAKHDNYESKLAAEFPYHPFTEPYGIERELRR